MRVDIPPTLLALVAACLAAPGAARHPPSVWSMTEDFAAYAAGSDASPAWEAGPVGWQTRGGALESDGAGHAFTVPARAPHARRMVFEAVVRPLRAVGKDWKTAGLAVLNDEGNYWHLALVEAPDSAGKAHFVELTEMLGGRWLANFDGETALASTADEGGQLAWQYDHPYRLRIELAPDGILGTVSELDGGVLARRGWRFAGKAVTSGRPALCTSALGATFDDFSASVAEAAPPPPARTFPRYDLAPAAGPRGRRTGFFHVERLGGRWWIVDPNGAPFYGVGTDHVNYNVHWCEKLGYAPYARNVAAKHGSEKAWAASATGRLKRWGFNLLGAGCSESVRYRGLAHTAFLSLGADFTAVSDIAPRTTWTGFPDVFHPRFAAWCEARARQLCAPVKDDPWLLGYFLDNELEWFGKNGSDGGLFDEAMRKAADHPARRDLVAFLRARYTGDVGKLNAAWKTSLTSFDALPTAANLPGSPTPAAVRDRRDWVRRVADRYFAVTTAAIRKADPNHMVLGCRFAGIAPPIWDIAGRYLDIVSVNYYGQVDLERGYSPDMPGVMARYHAQAKRPLMVTEWSFPALDAGLPSQHGAGQRVATQKDKARAFSIYQRTLFGMPFVVGSDYFMWVDEPALGISSTFPEDSNYGLVDEKDRAWPELTAAAARLNPTATRLHAGRTAELAVSVAGAGDRRAVVTVRNRGSIAARTLVRVWVQGKPLERAVSVVAGGRAKVSVPVAGPALVAAQVDPDDRVLETDEADNRAERLVGASGLKGPHVVVLNPSSARIERVPVAVLLGARAVGWRAVAPGGKALPTQVDALPGGAELAFVAPALPARSAAVFALRRDTGTLSRRRQTGDRDFALGGSLRLEHTRGSGDLFGRVALADTELGRFTTLVQQSGGQSLWVQPDTVTRVVTWTGPVRGVALVTSALARPATTAVKTAVGQAGIYAPQEARARRYETLFRIVSYPSEPWFGARFVEARNTDSASWRCAAYYHYPLSRIAGSANDDRPATASRAVMWRDGAAGLVYGAVVDTDHMRATFWKDTPDGPGEHPDIWRDLGVDLRPGQAVRATAADREVLVFGGRDDARSAGGPSLARLQRLQSVRAVLSGLPRP